MSYIIESQTALGRKEYKIDLPRFAKDLCKALADQNRGVDVKLAPAGDYPNEQQSIQFGADRLDLSFDSWKRRINAYANAPEVAHGDWSTYDKAQRTDSASVSPDARPIESIAKDLHKRVIVANQPALAARRAYADQQKQNRSSIVQRAAALKAAWPMLDIRVNEREQSATVYNRGPIWLDASLSPTGRVSIQRIGGVSTEIFGKILAALESEEAK
jgi:hypothetical protein